MGSWTGFVGLLPPTSSRTPSRACAEQITGPGGLLTRLAGRAIVTALGAELSEHVRNDSTTKRVQTDPGPPRGVRAHVDDARGSSAPPVKLAADREDQVRGATVG